MNYLVGPRSRLVFSVILLVFLAASRMAAQEPMLTLHGHRRGIYALEFSPDGKVLASATKDGIVKLWDVSTGREIRTFPGHLGEVLSLAFSPGGKTLFVGGGKRGLINYEIQLTGVTVTKVPGAGELKLWDVSSGKELKTVKFDDETVRHLLTSDRQFVVDRFTRRFSRF